MRLEQEGVSVPSKCGPLAADGIGKWTLARAGLSLTPGWQGGVPASRFPLLSLRVLFSCCEGDQCSQTLWGESTGLAERGWTLSLSCSMTRSHWLLSLPFLN